MAEMAEMVEMMEMEEEMAALEMVAVVVLRLEVVVVALLVYLHPLQFLVQQVI
jgi:hypothetical protein